MAGFNRADYTVVIDQEFVNTYYAGTDNNHKLTELLKNQTKVAVLFPDPLTLTREFCHALGEFVKMIRENAVYREVLAVRSSYENYFCTPTAS